MQYKHHKLLFLPVLTRELVGYNIPKWGPDRDRNVWTLSRKGRSSGWLRADLMIMFPREWPTKLRRQNKTFFKGTKLSKSSWVMKEKRLKPYFCWNQIVSFNVMRDFSHQFIGHLFKCHERVRLQREEQRWPTKTMRELESVHWLLIWSKNHLVHWMRKRSL